MEEENSPISVSLWFLMSSASSKLPAMTATWRATNEEGEPTGDVVKVYKYTLYHKSLE